MKTDFEELLSQIKKYQTPADCRLVHQAYQLAVQAHAGQTRLSGEAFINHPLAVAATLARWQLDSETIAAGLLHDVVEESQVSLEKITKDFGPEIAKLVDGVTKVGEYKLRGQQQAIFVENLRKLIVVMAKDLRVVLLKLADRYHNLQTLDVLPLAKQRRIARETIEIYAPLAERLGIGEMKGQLEDLAFPYFNPDHYQWLKTYSRSYFQKVDEYLLKIERRLIRALAKRGIAAQVSGRRKHLYSLYQKLQRPEIGRDLAKIYDLAALRVIVATVEECYAALGIIHQLFRPVPSVGVRDFIAQPKPNGYQSIHTNVFCLGRIIEIQVRTRAMHDQAENGIAAHWHYSENKTAGSFAPTQKMAWVKKLVQWQAKITDSQELIVSLRFDALSHRNFIFSPQGDVFDLPAAATPVDFAYAVHTDLGDHCAGVKVDGKLVPLHYQLKSGQIVEILVNKHKKAPSRDWLNFAVTHKARQKIRGHFR